MTTDSKEEKGFFSNLKKLMTKDCYLSYDAGNKKCSSCEKSEQCKKDTADVVNKNHKGWFT